MPDDPDRPDFDRPGFNDLVTPFIFVKHGAPDPVAWKQANPGWVSFPATFIPHKKPGRRYTVINGRRWPLDKRGQPWPRSRFGQPLCPLDEFPPGVPAPGTQGKLIEEQQAAIRQGVEAFLRRETSVEWFLETGARHRAERDARDAANPTPPSAPWAHTYDPMAPARDYLAMMTQVDAYTHAYAGGARQRNAMRAEAARPVAATEQQADDKAGEHPIEGVQQSDAAEAELAHPAAATEQQPSEKSREQPTEGVQQPSAAEMEAARRYDGATAGR